MSKLKIAFSGARRAGSFYRAFQSHPETEIVALCDPYAPALAAAAATSGITQLYSVYDGMLDEARPDAVVVSSPMHFHAAQAIAALQRDIHVLSEVTAAVSIDEARWLVQACKRSTAIYMMAENYVYMKPNVLVQAMVEADSLARPTTRRANICTSWRRYITHRPVIRHGVIFGRSASTAALTQPTVWGPVCAGSRSARRASVVSVPVSTPIRNMHWRTRCCCSARRRMRS